MSDEKRPWWKTVLVFLGGLVTGLVAVILGRKRFSERTRGGINDVGQCVDEIGESVERAEERVGKSVDTANGLAETSESVAESVERLTDGNDKIEDAISDARESVGRLKSLIEAERKRNEQSAD